MPDLLSQLMSVFAPARPDPALATSLFTTGGGALPPGPSPTPGVPLPMRRPQAAVPPVPMRRPEPTAPPLPTRRPEARIADMPPVPVRRPGLPNVPGSMADRSVPPAGPGAPSGMPDLMNVAGQSDLVSQMRSVLAGGPQPAAAPIETSSIGPFETTVTPADSGPSITGRDVASFFRNLARGAATADPTAPPLSAFAQGMAGSMVGMDKEAREAAATEAAADDREFERRMKTSEQRRAEAKERRESRRAEIENTKAVTEIMRSLGGDLTTDQKFRFEGAIRDYAKAINPNGIMDEAELKQKLQEYRQQLMGNISGQPQGGAAPSQFQEGQTATGPNGQKIIFRGGRWQPLG